MFGRRQKDSPYSGVIAIFISRILEGKNPQILGDGQQSRDFTYIDDVIRGNILAGKSSASAGKVLNLAAGKPISLIDLTNLMIDISGQKDLQIEYGPIRTGDILHSYGDITQAKDILGFEAEYDALSGFKKYFTYFKDKFYPE